MSNRFHNEQGFTIMEVLVGAVVFMIGFVIVILALNGTLVKLSTNEVTTARGLGREFMELAVARHDTVGLDTLVYRSGLTFRVHRTVSMNNDLAAVRLHVGRPRQQRLLVDLYYEYPLAKE